MSRAQVSYATQIVKYFDKHPEAGVDLTVDEVLENMDVWTSRHQIHKQGRGWLDDDTLTSVTAEIRQLAAGLEPLRIAAQAAQDHLRIHGRTLTAEAEVEATAASRQARLAYVNAREAAARSIRDLADRHDEQYRQEIIDIAVRKGVIQ